MHHLHSVSEKSAFKSQNLRACVPIEILVLVVTELAWRTAFSSLSLEQKQQNTSIVESKAKAFKSSC